MVKQNSLVVTNELGRARIVLQRAINFNLFTIFQYDYLEREMVPMHTYGDPFNLVDAVNFRVGKGATGWCLQHNKALLIKNLNREGSARRFFVNSFLAVPIIMNANIVGAVVLGHFQKEQFDDADRFLLEIVAPLIGDILLKEQFNFKEEFRAVI